MEWFRKTQERLKRYSLSLGFNTAGKGAVSAV
jgi:hypothetical protein